MNQSSQKPQDGDDGEVRHQHLRALLEDMVARKGRAEAARELGLDQRTVSACLEGDGLSLRVRKALERALREDGERDRLRRRNRALERQVGELKEELRELRLAETARREPEPAPAVEPPPRHREVASRLPAPGDPEAYGPAWPLVEEWRRLWAGHDVRGRGLAWLETRERILDLEVLLITEHGLTLPPEVEPLRGLWRSSQLNWRREALREVRRSLARRWPLLIVRDSWRGLRRWLRGRL